LFYICNVKVNASSSREDFHISSLGVMFVFNEYITSYFQSISIVRLYTSTLRMMFVFGAIYKSSENNEYSVITEHKHLVGVNIGREYVTCYIANVECMLTFLSTQLVYIDFPFSIV
jgi:hypothetical protein